MKSYKNYILIIIIFILTSLLLGWLIQISPDKFFQQSGANDGISLVWDEHELGIFYDRVGYYYAHQAPYAYERVEYPALGLAYLTVPALFFSTSADYNLAIVMQNLLMLLILVLLTYRIMQKLKINKSLLWLFLLPTFIYFTINRFDIFPAVLIQAAILLMIKRKYNWSFLFLSLSCLAKGYALVLFPIFLAYYLFDKKTEIKSHLWNIPLWIFITPVIIFLLVLVIWVGLEPALFPYVFQSSRQLSYGSIFGVFVTVNWQFFPEIFWDWFKTISSKLLTVLQCILPLFVFVSIRRFKNIIKTPQDLVGWSFLMLSIYIFFSPYYSPQWTVWLLPLLLLFFTRRNELWFIIIFEITNYLFFPVIYGQFGYEYWLFDVITVLRTVTLFVLMWLVVKKLRSDNQDKALLFVNDSQ